MIHLSGLEVCDEDCPDGDIEIIYSGLRPGEKLYEELLIGDNVSGTKHPKIMRASEEKLTWEQLLVFKNKFESAIEGFETNKIKVLLEEVVSGYKAENDIVDPVWNQNRLLDADKSTIEVPSNDDVHLH